MDKEEKNFPLKKMGNLGKKFIFMNGFWMVLTDQSKLNEKFVKMG